MESQTFIHDNVMTTVHTAQRRWLEADFPRPCKRSGPDEKRNKMISMSCPFRGTRLLLAVLFFGVWNVCVAQNSMRLAAISGLPGDTLTVGLNVVNTDSIVAFQTTLQLPVHVQYIPWSATLTARSRGHELSALLHPGNSLTLLCFQVNQIALADDSGDVLTFRVRLLSVPGNLPITLSSTILSDTSGANVLTQTVSGAVLVITPKITLSSDTLSYGWQPLLTYPVLTFSVSNTGTDTLTIRHVWSSSSVFVVQGDTAFSLAPLSSRIVSIEFHPILKGSYSGVIFLSSNDRTDSLVHVGCSAIAYPVNEFRVESGSGRADHNATIRLSANNMEPFTGFQFDLTLPPTVRASPDTLRLIPTGTDHSVRADVVSPGRLRVTGQSPTLMVFPDSTGDLLYFSFHLLGPGGTYPIGLEHVIMADTNSLNSLSASFGGSINIAAPNILTAPTQQLGMVSSLDTVHAIHPIYNSGNDTLFVSSIMMRQHSFTILSAPSFRIPPGQFDTLLFSFHQAPRGDFRDTCRILSNDPDQPLTSIALSATVYVPDTVKASHISGFLGTHLTYSIHVENHEPFSALQADLHLPSALSYDSASISLTGRAQGHSTSARLLPGGVLRILTYSLDQLPFTSDTGAVVTISLLLNGPVGTYPVNLTNVLLSDTLGVNICMGAQSGSVQIRAVGASLKAFLQGPFVAGTDTMRASLNLANYLPEHQPYDGAPWSYSGDEHVSANFFSAHATIIDWLLIDLRTDQHDSTRVCRRAALMNRDGALLDLDGTSSPSFYGVVPGNYFLILHHRNHLPIMSATRLALSDSLPANGYSYDFTTDSSKAFGVTPMKNLGGAYGLWAGDVNANGQIKYNGSNNDRALIFNKIGSLTGIVPGYFSEDVLMDGQVKYNGSGNDRTMIFNNLGTLTGIRSTQVP